MGGCPLEAIFNACTVVGWIAFEIGAPFDLFREDNFAVDHCSALTITASEVKAETVALERADATSGWWQHFL